MSKPHFAYPGQPSEDLVELYHATLAYLQNLLALLKPAPRAPDAPASPDAIAFARFVLADVVRVTSRLHGPNLLPLAPNITTADLNLRLGMAAAALGQFRTRYYRAPMLTDDEKREIENPEPVWWTNEYLEEREEIAAEAAKPKEPLTYEQALDAWNREYVAHCYDPGYVKKPKPVPPAPEPASASAEDLDDAGDLLEGDEPGDSESGHGEPLPPNWPDVPTGAIVPRRPGESLGEWAIRRRRAEMQMRANAPDPAEEDAGRRISRERPMASPRITVIG